MKKYNVFVCEEDNNLGRIIMDLFQKRLKWNVVLCNKGKQLLDEYHNSKLSYDLVILDGDTLNCVGWSSLVDIKHSRDIPVIILQSKQQTNKTLNGYSYGTIEYIYKPFSVETFLALSQKMVGETVKLIKYGVIKIDFVGKEVSVLNNSINLTPKEFDLLVFFIKNKGVAFSRMELISSVWKYDFSGDLRTIDTHIKQLRKKISEASKYIKTVRNSGYKMEQKYEKDYKNILE